MFSWFRSKKQSEEQTTSEKQTICEQQQDLDAQAQNIKEDRTEQAQDNQDETQKQGPSSHEASPAQLTKTDQPTSWFSRLKKGLKATSAKLFSPLSNLFTAQGLNEEGLKPFKKSLIEADLGSALVQEILAIAQKESSEQKCLEKIQEKLLETCVLAQRNIEDQKALMMIGVNGAGKTTTCAKLAHRYQNKKPLLVAADTFRAAATQQLELWAQEHKISFYKNEQTTCSAAISYEGFIQSEKDGNELTIIDTSGRLHTSKNLMQELRKVHKVILKKVEQCSLLTLLTLDAQQGQNMLRQVEVFNEYVPIDGLVITKIDGTSKAGAIFSIMKKFQIPVYFIGCGESLDDLQLFEPEQFIKALFEK